MSIKTFREFLLSLQEAPQENIWYDTEKCENEAVYLRNKHNTDWRADSKHIGGGNHKHVEGTETNYTHRDVNGQSHEVSRYKGNVQQFISKGTGDVKHIIKHLNHHIKTHGEVITDRGHSAGAKNHWISYIKSKPTGVKFEVSPIDRFSKPLPKYHVDHTNIDAHIGNIWGKESTKSNTTVRAYADTSKK